MRLELYRVDLRRGERTVSGFVVAPGEQRASEIVIETERAMNRENGGFTLERVDEMLPDDQRDGLEGLLETAPVGLASYCQGVGWIAHAVPVPQLHLYRIEEVHGDEYFVIAPSGDVAAAVYCECVGTPDNKPVMFRIHDGMDGLEKDAMRGLPALLAFGPVGMVARDDSGWAMMH